MLMISVVNLNENKIGCMLQQQIINHLFYADDLVLFSPSVCGLNVLLRVCEEFGIQNDVIFNSKKSKVMIVRSKLFKDFNPCFYLYGSLLQEVNDFKYLGYIISNDLSDDKDIERQRKKLYIQGNLILRKFHMCTIDVKIKLFTAFCTPMYICYLWCDYKQLNMNKLCTAYHNICKLFLNISKYESTSLVCAVYNIPTCKTIIRKLSYKFICRLELSENVILKKILCSSICFLSKLRKNWLKMLYVYFLDLK